MKYTMEEIFSMYGEPNEENRGKITEEFANKMLEDKEALNKLEVKNATPSQISQAYREVMKREGPKIVNYSGATLMKLVNEVLLSNKTLCA